MSMPQRTVNVRLSAELAERFDALSDAVPGLPKGVIMRMLLADQFGKPLDEQVRIVTSQLLKPQSRRKARQQAPRDTRNRIAAEG